MTRTAQTMFHYPIDLPSDYDMGIIRDRVRTRGHALDDRAGLWFKAYCVREVGVAGATANQYAPFYVWHDAGAAAEFLWGGGGFAGIVRDFARPQVDSWLPVAVAAGETPHPAVAVAQLRRVPLPRGDDLTAQAQRLRERVEASARTPGVHLACAGIDPTRWEAVEFTTCASGRAPSPEDEVTTYAVLHVSQPT
jgi:hypothetical protein